MDRLDFKIEPLTENEADCYMLSKNALFNVTILNFYECKVIWPIELLLE